MATMYVTIRATLQIERMMLKAIVLPIMIMLKTTVEPRVTNTAKQILVVRKLAPLGLVAVLLFDAAQIHPLNGTGEI